mgnify:CR=1 FL=1
MTKTKILWLSDIHIWDQEYSQFHKIEIEDYFKSFHNFLENSNNGISDYDYIILSGDIAFAGVKADYDLFNELFFKKLKNKNYKLIVCGGNHDINRKTADELIKLNADNTFDSYKKRKRLLNIKKKNDLNGSVTFNYTEFTNNFADYISFFNANSNFKGLTQNDSYQNTKLFGSVIDNEKELIFVIINTAWFSLGNGMNDLMEKRILQEIFGGDKEKDIIDIYNRKDKEFNKDNAFASVSATFNAKEIRHNIKKILNEKDSVTEYGSQLYGEKLFKELNLIAELFEKHPDYTSFCVMHHPPNWLNWLDRFDYDSSIMKKKPFYNILSHSNFLLTGHEHVPSSTNFERLNDDLVHLKAGCFLDELKDDTVLDKLTHNRFSVLELHTGINNWLTEKIFTYTPTESQKWKLVQPTSESIFFKNKFVSLPHNDRKNEFNLVKYCADYLPCLSVNENHENLSRDSNYLKFKVDVHHFYIPLNLEGQKSLLDKIYLIDEFKDTDNKQFYYVIVKDIFRDDTLYSELNDVNSNQSIGLIKRFDEIRESRENKFHFFLVKQNAAIDKLRNAIFSELAKKYKLAQLLNISLDITFVPYWKFEKYEAQ